MAATSDIPASCRVDYVNSNPEMFVRFVDHDDAQRWLSSFVDEIGGPFCEAANSDRRVASLNVVVGAGTNKEARRWSCEFQKWGDWFALNADAPAPSASSIADAIQACRTLQANRDIPISCGSEHLHGVDAMMIGFSSESDVTRFAELVERHVTRPFCDAANRVSRRAALYFTVAAYLGRRYDCEQRRWGEWIDLSPETVLR